LARSPSGFAIVFFAAARLSTPFNNSFALLFFPGIGAFSPLFVVFVQPFYLNSCPMFACKTKYYNNKN